MTDDALRDITARALHGRLDPTCDWATCPQPEADYYCELAEAVLAELPELEQVGWAVLKEDITSWRRIEEGTTGGGSQFWRDAVPVYIKRS